MWIKTEYALFNMDNVRTVAIDGDGEKDFVLIFSAGENDDEFFDEGGGIDADLVELSPRCMAVVKHGEGKKFLNKLAEKLEAENVD